MTSARGNQFQEDGASAHGQADPPTAPVSLPRRRRTPRLRVRRRTPRRPSPARRGTVWPCAQGDPRDGAGLLADWLLTAVVKIVTAYTRPGQRVLLLDPAPYFARPVSWSGMGGRQSQPGPYAGLHEAGWTVVRLGRNVQTLTDVARSSPVNVHPSAACAESESGLGPDPDPTVDDKAAGPFVDRRSGVDSAATDTGPDRHDLVITASESHTGDWFRRVDWAGLLTPSGTLAIVTHSDRPAGRLIDPAGSLVHAARQAGLRYLDRIVLLRVPVRGGVIAVASQNQYRRPEASSQPLAMPARHVQVHDDLFVFTRQSGSSATRAGGDIR